MKISDNRLLELKEQRISLREIFKRSENNRVQIFFGKGFSEENITSQNVSSQDIDEYDLPGEEYCFVSENNEARIEQQQLTIESRQRQREMFFFRIFGESVRFGDVGSNTIGSIITKIQGTINSIALSIQEISEDARSQRTGQIPSFVIEQTQLNPVGVYRGSYGIKFAANKDIGFFKETSLLKKSFNIIEDLSNNGNKDNIDEKLGILKYRAINKTNELFSYIHASDFGINFGYAYPNDEVSEVIVSPERATELVDMFDLVSKREDNIIEISGILLGMNLNSKKFSIKDTSDNITYEGKVDPTILEEDAVKKAQLSKKYLTKIKVEHTYVGGEGAKKYVLTAISYER